MHPLVLFQEILGSEGLFADIAFPLLVIMNLHVLVEMGLSLESLVANLAFETRMFEIRFFLDFWQ